MTRTIALFISLILLAGCGSTGKKLDASSTPPSEFRQNVVVVNVTTNTLEYYDDYGEVVTFPVATAKDGKEWSGITTVGTKKEFPSWRPTDTMVASSDFAAKYPDGLKGGHPENPLGSRALYLYSVGGDTLYRIHGTSDALRSSIGTHASSGCIRMLNEDIEYLYERVRPGTTVIVTDGYSEPVPYVAPPEEEEVAFISDEEMYEE